jgi:ABC-type transporter Mla subunit MlaD
VKKGIAIFLCIIMSFTVCPLTALSAGEADPILIASVEDLISLSQNCVQDTWSVGKTVRLTCNLDITNSEFTPIPLFSGIFDGGGYEISGFTQAKAGSTQGLFRQVLEGAVVKNLTVSGTVSPEGTRSTVGGIAGTNYGTIADCTFLGTVSGSRYVGGIAGSNQSTGLISGCQISGSVTGEHQVGGIAGENYGVLTGCTSHASTNIVDQEILDSTADALPSPSSILSEDADRVNLTLSAEEHIDITDVGGIAGFSAGVIQQCSNDGTVGYPHIGYNIGGIAGRQSGYISSCTNSGKVLGRKDVGGIVGQMDPHTAWTFTEGKLKDLQTKLNELQSRIDRTFSSANASVNGLNQTADDVLDAMHQAGSAAESLAGEAEDWADTNLSVINEFSTRVSDTLDDLVPIGTQLGTFSEGLSDTAAQFSDACSTLQTAVEDALPGIDETKDALDHVKNAMQNGKAAADDIASGIGLLKEGLGSPQKVKAALKQLSNGFHDLSAALDEVSRGLEQKLPSGSIGDSIGKPGELLQQILDFWNTIKSKMTHLSNGCKQAARALSSISDSTGDLLEQLDPEQLVQSLTQLEAAFSEIGTSLTQLESASGHLQDALSAFRDAGSGLSEAADQISVASDTLSAALDTLHQAVDAGTRLIDHLAQEPTLQFTLIDRENTSQQELFGALDEVNSTVNTLADELTDTQVLKELQSVSDQLFSVFDFLVDTLTSAENIEIPDESEYTEDVSSQETQTTGTVSGCTNQSTVTADTNVGGIAGAVTLELSFDQEDQWNLSALLSSGAKYLIYASIQDCANYSTITADKSTSGGIAGRMDYGAVFDCQSGGSVSSKEDYAGGITGYSTGTLKRCCARTNVSGSRYVGGIAGSGGKISDCRALPHIEDATEYKGSIAGYADSTIAGNYYAESSLGGIDGFSFAGQAEEISYDAMLALNDIPDLFRSITITFLAEGETVAEIDVPFGGSLTQLPKVPDRDGKYWVWDSFDADAIYYSFTVEGSYRSPISTLSTEEDPPLFLVEGTFYEGQSLTAAAYNADCSKLPGTVEQADVLLSNTLLVNDYGEDLTVRMKCQESGILYIQKDDGSYEKTSVQRDGSYLVFPLKNGGSFVYVHARKSILPYFVFSFAGLILAAAAVFFFWKKKKARAQTPPDQSVGPELSPSAEPDAVQKKP